MQGNQNLAVARGGNAAGSAIAPSPAHARAVGDKLPASPPPTAGAGAPATARIRPPVQRLRTTGRMTMEGMLYISLSLLIGLAALNTGTNLLYLVLALMLALLIVSGQLARTNLRHVSVQRLYPLEFHAGQAVPGLIRLKNRKRVLSCYAARVHDAILGPIPPGSTAAPRSLPVARALSTFSIELRPGEQAHLPIELKLEERGLYQLRELRIASRFPFGFKEAARRLIDPVQILVYPRLLPPLALLPHVAHALGDISDSRRGMGSSLYGVRDYRQGDPLRFVHWKLSAKGAGMKVKEFEQEASRAFLLMIDLRCPAHASPALLADFEKALAVAATLARLLMSRDGRVGLWTTRGNVPPSTGTRHLQRIMRTLAQIGPQPPEAKIIHPENAGRSVTQIWLDYQTPDNSGARAGSVVRRATLHHAIDVRKIVTEA